MEADSTQQKMLKVKKKRNLSTSVSSVSSSSVSSSSDEESSSSGSSSSETSNSSSLDDKRRRKKPRRSRKKKTRKKSSSDSESELDLTKELFPISGYIKTKDVMLEQMFKSISRKKLKAMLPDILKSVPLNKLKKMCLDQLEVMSKKRIYRTLAGENPDAISSSGTDESAEVTSLTDIPQKPDLLQNIEPMDQVILADVINIIGGEAKVTSNTLVDNADKTESVEVFSPKNKEKTPCDNDSDSVSCSESVPSSLPDLESEPGDYKGPFISSDQSDSENSVDNVSMDNSNDSASSQINEEHGDCVEKLNLTRDAKFDSNEIIQASNEDQIECVSLNPDQDVGCGEEPVNNKELDINVDIVRDADLSCNLSIEPNSLYIEPSSTRSNQSSPINTDVNEQNILENNLRDCDSNKVKNNLENLHFLTERGNSVSPEKLQIEDGHDLFSSSDINAMIMKIDDKEFIDEEEDDFKIESTMIDKNIPEAGAVIKTDAQPIRITPDKVLTTISNVKSSAEGNLTELEILELEMRARAIKAMIKCQEDNKGQLSAEANNCRKVVINSRNTDKLNNLITVDKFCSGDGKDEPHKKLPIKARLGNVVVSTDKTPLTTGLCVNMRRDSGERQVDLAQAQSVERRVEIASSTDRSDYFRTSFTEFGD